MTVSVTQEDIFAAGVAMEEAREEKKRASERLREVTAKRCPDELADYDRAATALAGRKVDPRAVNSGTHSHDGGKTCGKD